MELSQQQVVELNQHLIAINEILGKKVAKPITQKDIVISLCDYGIITDANESNNDFIQQVFNLVNDSCMSVKKFRNLLSRIAYQNKVGNVRNLKAYTINSICKETKQGVYANND